MSSHHPTRRDAICCVGAFAATLAGAGCRTRPSVAGAGDDTFQPGRFLWLRHGGRDVIRKFSGTGFTADSPFRVASISKLATAMTAHALAREGRIDLDADVQPLLPAPFRHPRYPGTPITLAHLLSHRAGLTDPPEYWVPAPGSISVLMTPDIFAADAEPGRFFRYSNLGYSLAATAMEAATGQRFDRLANDLVLSRLDMDAGFNWSSVSERLRRLGTALYRGEPGRWTAQVDADISVSGPIILSESDYDLSTYVPGTNGTLFSPQGGLRMSPRDLMALGAALPIVEAFRTPVWDATTDPGDTADGHFQSFGLGNYIYPADRSPVPGVRLIGHAGEAYGFYGGVWAAPDHALVFGFGVLGSPEGGIPMTGGRPNLRTSSRQFFNQVAAIL